MARAARPGLRRDESEEQLSTSMPRNSDAAIRRQKLIASPTDVPRMVGPNL
jgi:hypothetical protein